jgi:tellurite resistance protein TehA-like permease
VDAADALTTFGAEFLAAMILLLLVAAIFTWAILRAGAYPPQVGLIIALSLLSLVALGIGAATSSETALTIAATGVGALAASVTATFTEGRREFDARQRAAIQSQEREGEVPDDGAA